MTLAELKAVCAAYHEKEPRELDKNDVDLFVIAANNIRKNAEKLHTFEWNSCTAMLSVDGAMGGQLADAVISPADVFKGIKEVKSVSILRNNVYIPVDFTRVDIEVERERSQLELNDPFWFEDRYPSDAQFNLRTSDQVVVQRGQGLYLFPRVEIATAPNPITLALECYGFLNDYTIAMLDAPAAPDWFCEHADNYLQWAIIDDLNYLFQTFVPRQEGNVIPSPKDKRDEAWRDLLVWDAYMVDSHITRPK